MSNERNTFQTTDNKAPETKVTSASGATSSRQVVAYHLVPSIFWQITAGRFSLGQKYHGDVNYQKCIRITPDYKDLDIAFTRDRYNHGVHHLLNLKQSGNHRDDNIGAVAWFLSFAAWVELQGFDWQRILNPRYVNETIFRLWKDGRREVFFESLDQKEHFSVLELEQE